MNGSSRREVVVEAVLDRRADGDLGAGIQLLHRLGHDVRGIVADQLERVRIVAGDDGDPGVGVDHRRQVLDHAVDADGERRLGQRRGDVARQFGAGDRPVEGAHAAVRQGQPDRSMIGD